MPTHLFLFSLLFSQVLTAQAGFALPDARTGDICDQAARRASVTEDVPLEVLRAITRVETGRSFGGHYTPWPWTINVEGQGVWFDTEIEAKSYVFSVFKAGTRSFDVGCFQLNYRWHGTAFRSIDAMFNPDENALYAARFLKDLYAELGSWPAAAGAYHSRTPELARAYKGRFQTVLAQLETAAAARATGMSRDPFTGTATPLIPLQPAQSGQGMLGSLVPSGTSATAFIAFN
ncbi:MAG: transglycosylase SLT domain-containing protein [Pseudomonadota bacterium]